MKTIYKYNIRIEDEQQVLMPEGATIITAGLDPNRQLCLWAAVDTTQPLINRIISIFGTGQPIVEEEGYDLVSIDSVLVDVFMWHVFEKVREK